MPLGPGLPDLPVVEALDALRTELRDRGRAVLVAPPGAGKTTVVPLALLDEPWLAGGRIVMLEPRRLATRAAARRMASTTSSSVGELIGYQTRDERRIGAGARIEVVTEGVLTRRLQHDPELPGVGLVIFDEVHERNLPTDLGLALTLDVVATIRPDLRVLAMSATPDTDRLAALLDATVIESQGRSFDVEVYWAPRPPTRAPRRRQGAERVEPAVVSAVLRALREQPGDLLVFLPGVGEIRRTEAQLVDVLPDDVDVCPLAGSLSLTEQDAALLPSAPGRRRVVLSTDIAETSLTVDGVRVVVDSGLVREPRFDPRTGMTRLTTVSTSRASAEQRAGRAGRTQPGAVYRLWSKLEHGTRPAHRTPEILQTDLAGLALELAAWGGNEHLRFVDPPPTAAIEQARELLRELYALDRDDDSLTPLGRAMLGLPVHPRLARMIVVERGPLACVIAALLDERDVFRGRPDDLPADLALRVAVIAGQAGFDAADRRAVERTRERARDIARRAGIDGELDRVDPERSGETLLLAFPDRLAGRRRPGQFQLRSGSGAWLPADDALADELFLVAADLDGRRDRARIRLAAPVSSDEVLAQFGAEIVEQRTLSWDGDRDELVAGVERRLGALRLGAQTMRPEPGPDTTAALLARVATTRLDVLTWNDRARRLRERVEFLHRTVGAPWPDWSTTGLVDHLDEWLAPYLSTATSRSDLAALDLLTILRAALPWPEGAHLDELAPDELQLATGRAVPIDYSGEHPTASVRVQDVYGTIEHPHAGGRPIRLQLLSPADRPIQVTLDLPGFWRGTWAEVRKEMAGRYPKHRWPDDPTIAPPRRLKDR